MNVDVRCTNTKKRLVGVVAIALMMMGVTVSPAQAATTLPVLWTAGGLDSGSTGAGNSTRIATDASGNVAVVSGPALARDLAVTSYTASGAFRWRSRVSPSVGTFEGAWVVAAPNGDFVAVGYNVDSHGYPRASTLVRYASDGTLRWRVDLVALVSRLVVDAGGNTYLAFGAQDIQLQKYNASGVLVWASGATGTFSTSSLALSPDQADVVLTGSGGGATWMTAAFNTVTGARRWQVTAAEGLSTSDVVVDASRVYVTGEGNVGIYGFLTVVAYDRATGARLWRRDANPPTCCAYGDRIALAPDGSLVVAGHTATGGYFNWWIVAMNTDGAVRWQALRDAAVTAGDEIPAAVFVLADGTTVVSGTGGPVTRDILGNSYMQGVTAGYSPTGTLLWEAFAKQPTAWATALPNGDVCATGGSDALVTCWRVSGVTPPADTTPPALPTGLAGTAGTNSVALTWTPNTEPDLAGYRVVRNGAFVATLGLVTSYTDSQVSGGTEYAYALVAFDQTGNASAASAQVLVTPKPAVTTVASISGTFTSSTTSASLTRTVSSGDTSAVGRSTAKVKGRQTNKPVTVTVTDPAGSVVASGTGTGSVTVAFMAASGSYTWRISGVAGASYSLSVTYQSP